MITIEGMPAVSLGIIGEDCWRFINPPAFTHIEHVDSLDQPFIYIYVRTYKKGREQEMKTSLSW